VIRLLALSGPRIVPGVTTAACQAKVDATLNFARLRTWFAGRAAKAIVDYKVDEEYATNLEAGTAWDDPI
jgi:hypothetical protein